MSTDQTDGQTPDHYIALSAMGAAIVTRGEHSYERNSPRSRYLEIEDDLAHDRSEVPGLGDVTEDGWREAHDDDDEVCDGEVDYEKIGDGAQLTVVPDDEADQRVADESEHEHRQVERDQAPLERRRPDVVTDHVQVLLVADAVVVTTVGLRRPVDVSYRGAVVLLFGALSHRRDVTSAHLPSQLYFHIVPCQSTKIPLNVLREMSVHS